LKRENQRLVQIPETRIPKQNSKRFRVKERKMNTGRGNEREKKSKQGMEISK